MGRANGRMRAGTSPTVGFAAAGIRTRSVAPAAPLPTTSAVPTPPVDDPWDKAGLADETFLRLAGTISDRGPVVMVLESPALWLPSSLAVREYRGRVSIDRDRGVFVGSCIYGPRTSPQRRQRDCYSGPSLGAAINAVNAALTQKAKRHYRPKDGHGGATVAISRAQFERAFLALRP